MTRHVLAELLILRKRAATWILLAIWTLLGAFFAYVVPYALEPEEATGGIRMFLPESLPGTSSRDSPSSAACSRSCWASSRSGATTAGTR